VATRHAALTAVVVEIPSIRSLSVDAISRSPIGDQRLNPRG
jgi:hypothetical protein